MFLNSGRPAVIPNNVPPTIYGLDIQSNWSADLTIGNLLTVTNSISQANGNIKGGTLRFNGAEGGMYFWSGGTRAAVNPGAGAFTRTDIQPGAELKIQPGSGVNSATLDDAILNVDGTATWRGGNIRLDNGAAIGVSGTWDVVGDTNPGSWQITNPTLDPDVRFAIVQGGVLNMDTTSFGATIGVPFTMNGTLNVNTQSLTLTERTAFSGQTVVTQGADLIFGGTSTLALNLATLVGSPASISILTVKPITLNGAATISGAVFADGTNVTGNNNLIIAVDVTNPTVFAGTTFNGTGSLVIDYDAVLNFTPAGPNSTFAFQGQWALSNAGTVNFNSLPNSSTTFDVDTGSNFANKIAGVMNLGSYVINYTGALNGEGTFTNSGKLFKVGERTATIPTNFTNNAATSLVEIDGGTLIFSKAVTQSAGLIDLDGTALVVGGVGLVITGGTLQGGGTITAALVDNGGAIDQTNYLDFQTLTILGDYRQRAGGSLHLKIGRPAGVIASDELDITGRATLGGQLIVTGEPFFQALAGDSALILTFNNLVGDFANATLPAGMTTSPQVAQYYVRTRVVNAANHAPMGANNTVTVLENTPYTFTGVDFNFADPNDTPPDDFQAVEITTLPVTGTLTNNGTTVHAGDFISVSDLNAGHLVFTPAADTSGTVSYTFQVQDSGGSANGGVDTDPTPRTLTVNVVHVNHAPVVYDHGFSAAHDHVPNSTFPSVLDNATDADGDPLTAILVSGPSHGWVYLNSDGTFIIGFWWGYVGTDSFTFSAGDGHATSNVATVTFTLTNTAPVANDDGYSVAPGQYLYVSWPGVLGNDTDADGDSLSATVVSGPSHGVLYFFGSGFYYQPASGFSGTDAYTYVVSDGVTTGNIATVTLSVGAASPPPGAGSTVTTPEDTPYAFAAADFANAAADPFAQVHVVSLPAVGTLTLNGVALAAGDHVTVGDLGMGLLVFTPAANANGTTYTSFLFRRQDATGTDLDGADRTLTVDVTAVNDAPTGADGSFATLDGFSVTLFAYYFGFSDSADGMNANHFLGVYLTSLPDQGALTLNGVAVNAGDFISVSDINNYLLVYAPPSGSGSTNFTYRVRDDGGVANGGIDTDPIARTMTITIYGI